MVLCAVLFTRLTIDLLAQKYIKIDPSKACSYYGEGTSEELVTFPPDQQALDFVATVTKTTGIPQNFTLLAGNVRNALAHYDASTGSRQIIYSQDFMKKTLANADKWAAISIMAHEIGHHIIAHSLSTTNGVSKREQELEADRYSGHVLRQMSATLAQAKSAMEQQPDATARGYPDKSARLAAIENGWIEADEQAKKSPTSDTPGTDKRPGPIERPPTSTCSVGIRSTPAGAVVTVDGVRKGITPLTVELDRDTRYSIEMKKTGYDSYEGTIDCSSRNVTEVLEANVATIQLRYPGDYGRCSLSLRISIGDKSFTPTSNLFTVRNVPTGDQNYQINGQIACPFVGMCVAHGSGSINVADGGTYDVGWLNTAIGQCDVGLR